MTEPATAIRCDCGEPATDRSFGADVCWSCWVKRNEPIRAAAEVDRTAGIGHLYAEPEPEPDDHDVSPARRLMIEVDPVEEFAAVEEPGAQPLVGESDDVLVPEGGDAMFYGDGGAGKTTLTFDLAFHLAAGAEWLGMPVPHPARSLLIEKEGPRPLLRKKLRRKLEVWTGAPVEGRLRILRAPWASFTFASEEWRAELARIVEDDEIDVILAGPLTRIGMDSAGTLQEVVTFMTLVNDVRARCKRRFALILVHHENKGGAVSGAWEGAGDTLLHIQAAGPGHTILHIQKARWASSYHGRTLKLKWTESGEGFEVEGERDLLAEIVGLFADGSWRTIDEIRKGVGAGTEAVEQIIKTEHAERFEMRTGEDARDLGRSPKAQLYQVAS